MIKSIIGLFAAGIVLGTAIWIGLELEYRFNIPHLLPWLLILLGWSFATVGISGAIKASITFLAIGIAALGSWAVVFAGIVGVFYIINLISDKLDERNHKIF